MGTKVDTAELPPEEARVFEQLVESLEKSGAGGSPPSGKPDRFQFELTVTRGDKRRTFHLAEQELTAEARELVNLLLERARRPKG
jgi:emfourin